MLRAWLLAAALFAACQRPAPEPRHELTGAWLHEPDGAVGFELRDDGVLALLGPGERTGLAWNVSRGELVLSTRGAEHPEPTTHKFEITELAADRLVLEARGEPLAGRYRRGKVAHVRGVATYRERIALRPGAQLVLEVQRGQDPVAQSALPVRAPVPIPFDVSFVPTGGARYTLTIAIREADRIVFATPAPLAVTPDGEPLEVLLRAAPR